MNSSSEKVTPEVSVVIPAFNAENFICDAIESILNQNIEPIEIIVVNDKSTDQTIEALAKYGEKITLLTNAGNKGASYSRNRGIKAATGKYIAFLDADDLWLKNKLKTQLDVIKNNKTCDFIYTNSKLKQIDKFDILDESSDFQGNCRYHIKTEVDVFKNPYFSTSTILLSTQLCEKIGYFREDLKTAEDVDFCLKASCLTSIIEIEDDFAITRRVEGSLGASESSYQDNLSVIDSYVNTNPNFLKKNNKLVKSAKRKIYDDWLKDLIVSRQISKAITVCLASIYLKPTSITLKLLFKALILKIKYK